MNLITTILVAAIITIVIIVIAWKVFQSTANQWAKTTLNGWMGGLRNIIGDRPLHEITMPGATSHQHLSIDDLLSHGVRYFDTTDESAAKIGRSVSDFIENNPKEIVILNVNPSEKSLQQIIGSDKCIKFKDLKKTFNNPTYNQLLSTPIRVILCNDTDIQGMDSRKKGKTPEDISSFLQAYHSTLTIPDNSIIILPLIASDASLDQKTAINNTFSIGLFIDPPKGKYRHNVVLTDISHIPDDYTRKIIGYNLTFDLKH